MDNEIIVEVRTTDSEKATKALAEVTLSLDIGELTISRVKVIHLDGKSPWVVLPDLSFKDEKTGEYRHLPIIIPSRRLMKQISEKVLVQYNAVMGNGSSG